MPFQSLTQLSDVQRSIARTIGQFEEREQPPFISDLVRELGLSGANSLVPTLEIMQRNGFVRIQGGGSKGRARVASLTLKGRHALGLGSVPLLGVIPAGPLQEALQQPEALFSPDELLSFRPGDFLLRVEGDSMTSFGILNGDKVLLRPDVQVEHGEIAAVDRSCVTLHAGNPAYPDCTFPAADVRFAGVFRGLIRDHSRKQAL
jgi:SOS-response transcriptional repressor LexA